MQARVHMHNHSMDNTQMMVAEGEIDIFMKRVFKIVEILEIFVL